MVSALIGLLGALVARDILDLDLRLPTWVIGGNDVWRFTILGGVSAIIAGALLELLFVATPTPTRFFSWIVGLLTAAAAVLPFSQGGTTGEQAATAVIVILIGISVLSILPGVAARTMKPVLAPASRAFSSSPSLAWATQPGARRRRRPARSTRRSTSVASNTWTSPRVSLA